MKKAVFFLCLTLAAQTVSLTVSASKKKKYAKENDETNVKVWWDAKKYKTSKKYYRDHGNGVSNIQSIAEKKAMLDAKANLTKQIKEAVAVVETDKKTDVNGIGTDKFELFTKGVAEQSLSNVKTVSQTIGKKSDNSIDYNVVIQVDKAEIKKAIMSELDKEQLGLSKDKANDILKRIDEAGADNDE